MAKTAFFRNFLQHPIQVGALAPSSNALVNKLLSPIDWTKIRTVVECGPGNGGITRGGMKRLSPEGKFLGIEINPQFVYQLKAEFGQQPNFSIIQASAIDVEQLSKDHFGTEEGIDLIVTSLPFSPLPLAVRKELIGNAGRSLKKDGVLLAYQYARHLEPILKENFRVVKRSFVLRNFPPAFTYY